MKQFILSILGAGLFTASMAGATPVTVTQSYINESNCLTFYGSDQPFAPHTNARGFQKTFSQFYAEDEAIPYDQMVNFFADQRFATACLSSMVEDGDPSAQKALDGFVFFMLDELESMVHTPEYLEVIDILRADIRSGKIRTSEEQLDLTSKILKLGDEDAAFAMSFRWMRSFPKEDFDQFIDVMERLGKAKQQLYVASALSSLALQDYFYNEDGQESGRYPYSTQTGVEGALKYLLSAYRAHIIGQEVRQHYANQPQTIHHVIIRNALDRPDLDNDYYNSFGEVRALEDAYRQYLQDTLAELVR